MNPKTIETIFNRFRKHNPHPTTELDYTTPYSLLAAVVLSAQMTDKGVNKATAELFKIADTPEKMLRLGEEGLKAYIAKINHYRNKAKYIIALSRVLVEKHGGKIPDGFEQLVALPGIGSKSAKVILNTIFGNPVIAADTHVFRVANRLGMVKTTTPLATEAALEAIVPKKYKPDAHHWLILHGRYICQARRPLCYKCFLSDLCEYPHKNFTPAPEKVQKERAEKVQKERAEKEGI